MPISLQLDIKCAELSALIHNPYALQRREERLNKYQKQWHDMSLKSTATKKARS